VVSFTDATLTIV